MGSLEGFLLFFIIIAVIIMLSFWTNEENNYDEHVGSTVSLIIAVILCICFFSLNTSKQWCSNLDKPVITDYLVVRKNNSTSPGGLALSEYFVCEDTQIEYNKWLPDGQFEPVTLSISKRFIKEIPKTEKAHIEIHKKYFKYNAKFLWLFNIREEFSGEKTAIIFVPEGTLEK